MHVRGMSRLNVVEFCVSLLCFSYRNNKYSYAFASQQLINILQVRLTSSSCNFLYVMCISMVVVVYVCMLFRSRVKSQSEVSVW